MNSNWYNKMVSKIKRLVFKVKISMNREMKLTKTAKIMKMIWENSRLLRVSKMLACMVNKLINKKWNHTKTKVTLNRTNNFKNNKSYSKLKLRSLRKIKKTRMMTSSMTSSINSGRYSSKTKRSKSPRYSKRMICRNKYPNLRTRSSIKKDGY